MLAAALVGLALLAVPLVALLVRVPWSAVPRLVTDPDVADALRLSLLTSGAAALLAALLGVPLAYLLARVDFPGRRLARGLVVLPMILPPVVGGLALLMAFGRRGVLGGFLESAFDLSLPFTTAAVVVAQTFVALPFLVLTVEGGLRSLDRRYEEASATLGAGPWVTFRRVTLPLLTPAIGAGAVLAWARALGEFGATITFAGNVPGRTTTMPTQVFLTLQSRPEEALTLSVLLLAVSLGLIIGMRERWFHRP